MYKRQAMNILLAYYNLIDDWKDDKRDVYKRQDLYYLSEVQRAVRETQLVLSLIHI